MIVVFNDGKERHQSFEAVFSDRNAFGNLVLPDLTGYGADETEATGHLIQQLEAYQAQLSVITTDIVSRRRGRAAFSDNI